jgi:hypothetical protein
MLTRIGLVAGVVALLACVSGAAPVPAGADKKADDPEKARAEMMKRWNTVAKGVTFAGPGGAAMTFDWTDADKFPHPTFKGGSAEAYGAFAKVLAAFLEDRDNFDYLAKNKLLTAELRYSFPNGKASTWTFEKLVGQLSGANALGDHDEATRKSLKKIAEKIKPPKE